LARRSLPADASDAALASLSQVAQRWSLWTARRCPNVLHNAQLRDPHLAEVIADIQQQQLSGKR
jgi:hypothetical protein